MHRNQGIYCLACAAALLLVAGMLLAQTGSSIPVVTGDAKVDKLLSQMTLDEKISMIHGAIEDAKTDQGQAGYLPGVPRLGIPSLRLADGPPGVLTRIPATGLTTTLGLAATFSVQDAEQNGVVIARDARSLGIDIVLEPFINMYRVTGGRNANTFGEDPLLTGLIGASLIRGVQSQGVMAQAKHFIAYDGANDVIVDPQTLHEVYLAPFFDAIDAGVSSAMCAYNKVNGSYACGNDETQNTSLRGETGWKGFITSDWGATHATDFINRGLDLEMPGSSTGAISLPSFFTPDPAPPASGRGGMDAAIALFMGRGGIPEETPRVANASAPGRGRGGPGRGQDPASIGMLNAVKQGIVKEETITRAVGRILLQMNKFEFLDKAPKHDVTPIRTEANAPIIRKTAEDAAVLLKNDSDALPLTAADLQSVALIGPGARQTVAIGQYGERATGIPSRQIGAVEAIRRTAPNAKVTLAVADDMTGVPVPASALSHAGHPGLLRADAAEKSSQVDPDLNFTTANKKALPVAKSYRWTGSLTVARDGDYILALQVMGTGGTLTVDGNQLASTGNPMGNMHGNTIKAEHDLLPTTDGLDSLRRRVALKAGVHAVDIESMADTSGAPVQVRLNWITPEQQQADYDAAIAAAKLARKAVVFVWGRGGGMGAATGGEARLNALPGDQDKLIEDVAAVNPNTIVVMNVAEPTNMPWLGKVKSVLQMWWTGDEGGWAAANLLLGKVSPAGRLPYTWPKTADQMLNRDPAHPERAANPAGPTTYSEGVNIGYRYFDNENKEPLFPFGYGLSYTRFEYAGLKAVKAKDGGLDVSFTVRNTGKTASDEVPQVYLGAPKQPPQNVQFAPKALAAFERISLKPGESRPVTVHVAARRLQYWSVSGNKWVTATGARTVHIGASSRDLRLQADVSI